MMIDQQIIHSFTMQKKKVPLAAIILGRDAGLILSAFYYRYISLPEPV